MVWWKCIIIRHLACKNSNINFVTRVHGWYLYFERHEEAFLPFRDYIFKNAKRILPISSDGREYLLKKKLIIDIEKIVVSKLGVQSMSININYKEIK